MPLYSNSAFGAPFKTVARMQTDLEPNYLFGKFDNKTQPWMFNVANVTVAANVAIVAGALVSGGGASPNNVPSVGAKIGVRGTKTGSGIFNVDPTTAQTVTWSAGTGAISVTFPLTSANIATAPDSGTLVVQPFETPDLVAQGSSSAPVALVFSPDESDNSRCLYAEAKWTGTIPTTATVVLQVANVDDDSRYATVENSQGTSPTAVVAASNALASVAAGAVTQSGAQYSFIMGKFVRAKVLAMTGGDGTTGLVVTVFA